MNYAGKWMELENINLNEVTQKEGPSGDAWISLRRGYGTVIGGGEGEGTGWKKG